MARELYKKGYTTVEVGKMFNVHNSTIYRWCKDIIRPQLGENSPNYKGGCIVGGYKVVYSNGKLKRENRLVMEKYLGRELTSNEIVHHINRNTLDNDIKNLKLLSVGEHRKEHIGERYKGELQDKCCEICKELIPNKNAHHPCEWEKIKTCSKSCAAKLGKERKHGIQSIIS